MTVTETPGVESFRFIPVVTIKRIEDAIPTLASLRDGGLPVAEITFRTQCAEEAIRTGVKAFPDMCIGAGTVVNAEQCLKAIGAGAKFIVSPGLDEETARVCRGNGIPYIPGCVTPTEIMKAISLGLTVLKFFPANVYGGLNAVRALSAPFPQVRFVPTGGVDLSNLEEYLSFDKVQAVGGTFLLKGDIRANTAALVEKLKCIKS